MRLYNLKSNEQCLLTFCYSTYLLYEFLFLGITDANCLNYAFVYLVKEWSDQLNQFSSRHHLLIEENKTPQEVLIHLPALQRLPNLIEERELREGSVLPGFGEAHVLEHPQPGLLRRRLHPPRLHRPFQRLDCRPLHHRFWRD